MAKSPTPSRHTNDSLRISAKDARRLVLWLNGLTDPPARPADTTAILQTIHQLGYVQVDSVNTLARAHDMILFSRMQRYRPQRLRQLTEIDRSVFESWTHDAAIIPMAFYPHWHARFDQFRKTRLGDYRERFGSSFDDHIAAVRDRIQTDGPVMARDLAPPNGAPSGGWWNWHPAKGALEFMWHTGDLAITARQGFQKVYDLAERVIPSDVRTRPPTEDLAAWACPEALHRLAFASPAELARFWDLISIEQARQWCAESDEIVPCMVESQDGSPPRKAFARSDIDRLIEAIPRCPPRIRALSPFDPVLRDRARLKRLFDFDYRIEIFVPEPKRKYGYYVFPLLEGDRLIGRIDMKADRQAGVLNATALWLEPNVAFTPARQRRLETELDRLRRLARVDRVDLARRLLRKP